MSYDKGRLTLTNCRDRYAVVQCVALASHDAQPEGGFQVRAPLCTGNTIGIHSCECVGKRLDQMSADDERQHEVRVTA